MIFKVCEQPAVSVENRVVPACGDGFENFRPHIGMAACVLIEGAVFEPYDLAISFHAALQ